MEQPAQRVFWGAACIKGMIVIGADASNAFGEAPAPKAPLYVTVDQPYREWWRSLGRGEIPPNYVLPVRHALQGHPESPRLWAKHIDTIIQKYIGLKPTTHEPCLYHGEYKGFEILFLRQVDDFAVASKNVQICHDIINDISDHLSEKMKILGVIDRYNGVQVDQTTDYIKIHNTEYISKILQRHNWLQDKDRETPNITTPMRSDSKYITQLETSSGPDTQDEKDALQQSMNFSYRQALGEILYAMVTCRPDISFSVIKLSQYANNPAEIHYQALKNVFRYLRTTIDHGLYFWRTSPLLDFDLPNSEYPRQYHYENSQPDEVNKPQNILYGYMDSDWAGDVSHRRSVSGIAILLAGAVVSYKSKLQPTVALSSTEAEFAAASEAGKIVLYLRTILEEINVPQEHATTLYEDNDGALLMANAGQPTRRTRHIDIRYFALLDWVERDLLALEEIHSPENCSDPLTKAVGKNDFWKHYDILMGRKIPKFVEKRTYRHSLATR